MKNRKMRKYLFYTLIFVSVLLAGCDPGQSLVFVNKTASDAFVDIKTRIDSADDYTINLQYPLKELDSVIVIKPESFYEISFGIGTWHHETMNDLSRIIKEIKIESESKTVIYDSEKQIEELLKNNRKGSIGSAKINIEIN